MKDERIVSAFDRIAAGPEARARVWGKACQKQQKRRAGRRMIWALAAVAVFCLLLFGGPLLKGERADLFTVTAYALSQGEDGAIRLTEVDLLDDKPQDWGGYIDWEKTTLYVGLGFKCSSADLLRVEVATDDGFFARQYIGDLTLTEVGSDLILIGSEMQQFMYGLEFDIVGDTLTFDQKSLDDYLFFWGTTYEVDPGEDPAGFVPDFPDELRFQATATLENGRIAEQDVAIALPDKGATVFFKSTPEQEAVENQALRAHSELVGKISFADCRLDEERTCQLNYGDAFQYLATDPDTCYTFIINEETPGMLPEVGNVFRLSSYLPVDGSDGHIVTLARNGEALYTVTTYIVPGELILRYYEGGPIMKCIVYGQGVRVDSWPPEGYK